MKCSNFISFSARSDVSSLIINFDNIPKEHTFKARKSSKYWLSSIPQETRDDGHVALISLRSLDDWRRRPCVSCLYALQIGAQCQRPFPLPSRLAAKETRQLSLPSIH